MFADISDEISGRRYHAREREGDRDRVHRMRPPLVLLYAQGSEDARARRRLPVMVPTLSSPHMVRTWGRLLGTPHAENLRQLPAFPLDLSSPKLGVILCLCYSSPIRGDISHVFRREFPTHVGLTVVLGGLEHRIGIRGGQSPPRYCIVVATHRNSLDAMYLPGILGKNVNRT